MHRLKTLNEKNYPTPSKLYDVKDTEAIWYDDAEDYIYWSSEADKWAEDYAKSYKVKMSPKDFLDLTTLKGADSLKVGDTLGGTELRPLDRDELNKDVHQPIYLKVRFTSKNNIAKVIAHEGRHRMFALMQAGIKFVDVVLDVDTAENYDKFTPHKLDNILLLGQYDNKILVKVYNPIAMSWKQHKAIRPNLNESKQDELKLRNHLQNDDYTDLFLKLRNTFKSPYNDLYYWIKKEPQELFDYIDNIQKERQDKKDTHTKNMEGAEFLGEKDGYKVYHITTWEASKTLGQGAKWCISMKDNSSYWNSYTKEGIKFYFFISSQTKYALALYPKVWNTNKDSANYYINKVNFEVYNAKDNLDYSVVNQLPLELIKEELVIDTITFDENGLIIKDGVLIKCKIDAVNVIIPSSVTRIGSYAFDSCDKLTNIIIPNSVTEIGTHAFTSCISLQSIVIPNSVTEIDFFALSHCYSLRDVYYEGTEEDWNKLNIGFFNRTLLNANIHFNSKMNESLVESKQDQLNFKNWILKKCIELYPNISNETKDEFVNGWFSWFEKAKTSLKSPENDYYYWMKKDDIEAFMNKKADWDIKVGNAQKAKDGARLVYSDKDWKVYEITNYEASKKYGASTKWCITGSKRWANNGTGEQFWNNYFTKQGIRFYFFINKDGHKYALAVYPDNERFEIYNDEDTQIAYIPDAPDIKEIKVKYSQDTANDFEKLVDSISSNKLPFDLFAKLASDVVYENRQEVLDIYTSAEDFCEELKKFIPDNWDDRKVDDEYDGDLPLISRHIIDMLPGHTKESKTNYKDPFFSQYKYFGIQYVEEYYADDTHDIYLWKSFDDILYELKFITGADDWADWELDDFYGENRRMDIASTMIANQLIWEVIYNNKPSNWEQLFKSSGMSQKYIDNTKKAIKQQDDIKNHLHTSVHESIKLNEMQGKEFIKDQEILNIIYNCIDNLHDIGYDIGDDIDFMYGDTLHTFGTLLNPTSKYNPTFTLVLNKHMKDEPKESIENTIYHELAHYINNKNLIDKGILYIKDGLGLYRNLKLYNKSEHSSHGRAWKRIAEFISNRLNLSKPITTTDNYSTHTGVGEHAKAKNKYEVRCKNCGNTFTYTRKTDFVADPNKKVGYDNHYKWQCGVCKKSGMFEVKELK